MTSPGSIGFSLSMEFAVKILLALDEMYSFHLHRDHIKHMIMCVNAFLKYHVCYCRENRLMLQSDKKNDLDFCFLVIHNFLISLDTNRTEFLCYE